MKIVSIVGARPQFVKLGPLSKEIRKSHSEIIIHTGQHFDNEMSQQFFHDLNLPEPDYNLKIHGGFHGEQTGRMMIQLEKLILKIKPDAIIVFGDTNSTIAGAIVGAKLHIPIFHIEAGLRSYNRKMPEEINRILTDHSSELLLAPTKIALENLYSEGIGEKSVLTGDIMVDALNQNLKKISNNQNLDGNYCLMTLHRPYNVDNPDKLKRILKKLEILKEKIIFPIHPRTKNVLKKNKIVLNDNIILTKPLGYLDFLSLLRFSKKVITDSGGLQKEAYILKKPCFTIRPETEWVETTNTKWNTLCNPDDSDFIDIFKSYQKPDKHDNIFGENVARKMIDAINNYFTTSKD